jgi:hypothetical protein
MISEVYDDAFVAAGAPEDKARSCRGDRGLENRFSRIDTDLAVLKWMTGTILAGVVAVRLAGYAFG